MEAATLIQARINPWSIFYKVWDTIRASLGKQRISDEFYIHKAIPDDLCIDSAVLENILLGLTLNAIDSASSDGALMVVITWLDKVRLLNSMLKPTKEFHSRFQSAFMDKNSQQSRVLAYFEESQSVLLSEVDEEDNQIPEERPDDRDDIYFCREINHRSKKSLEVFQSLARQYEKVSIRDNFKSSGSHANSKDKIRAKKSDGLLRIEVYDSGYNLVTENEAFQEPYSVLTDHTDHLGPSERLQVVRALCESIKGKVKSLNKKQEGTQTVVILPASSSPDQSLDSMPKLNVMLVDDNMFDLFLWEESLKNIDGIAIEKAFNGKEAVDIFMSKPEGYFDVIVMDLEMPLMSGREAMKRIRHIEQNRILKVNLIAVSIGPDWREEPDSRYSDKDTIIADVDFYTKPLFPHFWEELIEKISREKEEYL